MEIEAVIAVVNEEQNGTSSKGNPWRSREVLLTWDEPENAEGWSRKQYLCVKLMGKSLELFEQRELTVGSRVKGQLACDTRKGKNDRLYNDILLWLD